MWRVDLGRYYSAADFYGRGWSQLSLGPCRGTTWSPTNTCLHKQSLLINHIHNVIQSLTNSLLQLSTNYYWLHIRILHRIFYIRNRYHIDCTLKILRNSFEYLFTEYLDSVSRFWDYSLNWDKSSHHLVTSGHPLTDTLWSRMNALNDSWPWLPAEGPPAVRGSKYWGPFPMAIPCQQRTLNVRHIIFVVFTSGERPLRCR